jgi:2-polyprenyl-6-methoxyphenol hydroxylase-like FAD-dependent oxidoreductase
MSVAEHDGTRKTRTSAERGADVLIVGAGPTGLTLAYGLTRYAAAVDIVDQRSETSSDSKALAINMMSQLSFGLLDPERLPGRDACRLERIELFCGDKRLNAIDFRRLPEGMCSMLTQPQSATERDLGRLLEGVGVHVERGVRLIDVEQRRDHVSATLIGPCGKQTKRSYAYVVGCEGKHSVVRDRIGAVLEGKEYDAYMVLGDFALRRGWEPSKARYRAFEDAFFVFVPIGEGTWRVVGLFEGLAPSSDVCVAQLRAAIARHFGDDFLVGEPRWTSRAQLYLAVASAMRRGRLMIAGDAAHLFSPLGGTGMNTGMQDAFNLSWKLGYALRGGGDVDSLLESYAAERLPVIRQNARETDGLMQLVRARSPEALAPLLPRVQNRSALRWLLPFRHAGLAQRYASDWIAADGFEGSLAGTVLLGAPRLLSGLRAREPGFAPLDFVVVAGRGPGDAESERRLGALREWAHHQREPRVWLIESDAADGRVTPGRAGSRRSGPGVFDPRPGEAVLVRPDGVIGVHSRGFEFGAIVQYVARLSRQRALESGPQVQA